MEKYQVVVSDKAQSDIAECISFVKNVSKEAAIKLVKDLYTAFALLDSFPEKNPLFSMPKTFPVVLRKQVVNKRYIVLYAVEKQKVVIYRVLDARRDFAQIL